MNRLFNKVNVEKKKKNCLSLVFNKRKELFWLPNIIKKFFENKLSNRLSNKYKNKISLFCLVIPIIRSYRHFLLNIKSQGNTS